MNGSKTMYLHVAFGNIKRGDTGMCDTASKDTTKHALGVVGEVVGHSANVSEQKM